LGLCAKVEFITLFVPFFTDSHALLADVYLFDKVSTLLILVLIVGYFFYAQHEARAGSSCTSCQSGNIIGTSIIALVKTVVLFIAAYFWINPS
jgi:hypothetical protein